MGNDGARFLACSVIADDYNDVTISIVADKQQIYTRKVTSRKPFRLPNHSNHFDWQFEITATSKVREISLANSMLELAKNG